ncbi:unnamed protein product [Sphagnum jensenii]|uniref:Uncharacterized protein n=1 Tax=Sphagnum jensenii TaxID=128206 RepID=A0ABP0VPK2_9BRYO
MKIEAIVDIERGLIQVRKGPGDNVEVLPLIMVNLLQNVNSETLEHEAVVTVKSASSEALEVDLGKMLLYDSVMDEQKEGSRTTGSLHYVQRSPRCCKSIK